MSTTGSTIQTIEPDSVKVTPTEYYSIDIVVTFKTNHPVGTIKRKHEHGFFYSFSTGVGMYRDSGLTPTPQPQPQPFPQPQPPSLQYITNSVRNIPTVDLFIIVAITFFIFVFMLLIFKCLFQTHQCCKHCKKEEDKVTITLSGRRLKISN